MDGEKQQQSAPKRRWKIWLWLALIVVCLIAGTALGGVLYVKHGLQPTESGAPVRVTIPQGAGSAAITQALEDKGIIRNAKLFAVYLKFKKQGTKFQAGEYEMTPGMSLDDIITKLNKGDVVKEEMLHFTIPEGFTIQQTAEKLGEAQAVDPKSFLALADSAKDLEGEWVKQIPDDPDLKHRLEGYLFPETYEMKKDSTEHDILQRLVSEQESRLSQLPSDWEAKMKERKLTFHQLLTVASLIEREVALDEERPIVASVIYNRLEKGMPLQIDATIQYLFDQPKERLYEKDLQIESPYNTYLHAGLPPGPIASPGLASIKAALYPAETNFLFYVTKKDGTKGHLFAETFEQHKKNIAKSEAQAVQK